MRRRRSRPSGRRRSGRAPIATQAAPEALRPDIVSGRKRFSLTWVATLPFFAYTIAFLFVPAGAVMLGAFPDETGHATFSNTRPLFHHPFIAPARGSISISLATAVHGA